MVLVALGCAWPVAVHAADSTTTVPDSSYVPCKVNHAVSPVFPLSLLSDGVVRGEVLVTLEIDPHGQLADSLVTAYTHRRFVDETLQAIKQWRFEPGLAEGRPVISILNITFSFETTGVVVIERHGPSSWSSATPGDPYEYRPHGVATLDRAPAPVQMPGPVYPKEWIEQGRAGTVVIDFFIDETGQARLPTIGSHTDVFLASSALAAVKQWRFEPPTRHGRPVLARAQQKFVFEPPTRPKAGS